MPKLPQKPVRGKNVPQNLVGIHSSVGFNFKDMTLWQLVNEYLTNTMDEEQVGLLQI